MFRNQILTSCVCACALGSLAGGAFGVTQTYFGLDLNPDAANQFNPTPLMAWPNATTASDQFQSNLAGVNTETFEGTSADGTPFTDYAGGPITDRIEFNPTNFARISQESLLIHQPFVNPMQNDGRYPTSGDNRLFIPQDGGGTVITFEDEMGMPAPQAAFGFFGVDIGDFGGALLVLTQMDGSEIAYDVSGAFGPHGSGLAANGSVLFFGIIDTDNPFTQITLMNTNSGSDGFAFDDFTIGQIENVMIPLPSVAGLGALGLVGLAARRRRSM